MLSAWIVLTCAALVIPSCARSLSSERAGHGLRVGELAVGGMYREPLEAALRKLDARLRKAQLVVRVRGHFFELDPERVRFRIDVAKTADAVLGFERSAGVLARAASWLSRWFVPRSVLPVVSVDTALLERTLAAWERQAIEELPSEGSLELEGEQFKVVEPRAGERIQRAGARQVLERALGAERSGAVDVPIEEHRPDQDPERWRRLAERAEDLTHAPVELVSAQPPARAVFEPATLRRSLRVQSDPTELGAPELAFDPRGLETELAALRPTVEIAARDASFAVDKQDRVTIVPSEPGTRLVPDALARALLAAASSVGRSGSLPIERDRPPRFTTEQARALRIDGKVAEFSTSHPCCQPRVRNIHRIADLLDGALVLPNQTLSLNAVVGERTEKSGFVAAPSIQDGEMVDTVGGGVSQFATTFFNAVFYGGYDILERQPHTYWFSRYPMGHEATLSWPKPDVIFRNDSDAGVLVKTSYTATRITVKLFGNNGGRTVKAHVSRRFDIIEPSVELLPNLDVPVTEERVKEPGSEGWTVIVGRQIEYPDGKKKDEQRKVIYRPRVRRVEVHPCRIPEGEPGHTGEPCPEADAAPDTVE